jgi:PII-like signaling protein
MQSPRDGVLLRAFVGEADRVGGHVLYRTIVDEARLAGLAGATVLHGPMSFGSGGRLNSEFNVEAPRNPPIVIEIVDTEDRIHAFLPRLDQLIGTGLVTLEQIRMFRCGRHTTGPAGTDRTVILDDPDDP